MRRRVCSERGFSLIETIVALGLIAGVVLSVAGLFLLGERQVARGRHQSEALAVAQTILEEMNGWSHPALWERFGLSGSAATATASTQTNSFAGKWQPMLDESLGSAAAEILLESCDGTNLDVTDAIRVTVRVWWNERAEQRDVELATVRL